MIRFLKQEKMMVLKRKYVGLHVLHYFKSMRLKLQISTQTSKLIHATYQMSVKHLYSIVNHTITLTMITPKITQKPPMSSSINTKPHKSHQLPLHHPTPIYTHPTSPPNPPLHTPPATYQPYPQLSPQPKKLTPTETKTKKK